MMLKWLVFGLCYAVVFCAGLRAGMAYEEDKWFEYATDTIKRICRRNGLNIGEEIDLNAKEVIEEEEAALKAKGKE